MNEASIETEALHLPAPARAKLAHKLLESLDVLSEREIESIWLAEAEKRLSEIDAGSVETISASKFCADAEVLFR